MAVKMSEALAVADAVQPGMSPTDISRQVSPLPDPTPDVPDYQIAPRADNPPSIQATGPAVYIPTLQEASLTDAYKPLPELNEDSSEADRWEYGYRVARQREAQAALALLDYQAQKDPSVNAEIFEAVQRGLLTPGATPEQRAAMVQAVAAERYRKVIEQMGYLPKEIVHDPTFQQFSNPEVYAYCKTVKDIYDEATGASTGPIDTLLRGWKYASATRDANIKFRNGEISKEEYESITTDAYYDYGFAYQQMSDTVAQTAAGFLLPLTDPELLAIVAASTIAGAASGALAGSAVPGAGTAVGAAVGGIGSAVRGLTVGLAGAYGMDTFVTSQGRMMYRAMTEGEEEITLEDAYKATLDQALANGGLAFITGVLPFGLFGHNFGKLISVDRAMVQAARAAKAAGKAPGTAAGVGKLRAELQANLAAMAGETAGVYGVSVGTMGVMAALEEGTVNAITGNDKSVFDAFMTGITEAASVMAVFSGISALPRVAKSFYFYHNMNKLVQGISIQAATDAAGSGMTPADIQVAGSVLNRLNPNKLYFNVDDVKDWATQNNIDLNDLGGDFARIDQLKQQGKTTIEIDQADWQQNYANKEVGKQLYQFYTTHPGGFTLKEIREIGLTVQAVEIFKQRNAQTVANITAEETDLQQVRSNLYERMSKSKAFADARSLDNTLNTIISFYRALSHTTGLKVSEIDSILNPEFGQSTLVLKPGASNPERLGGFDTANMKFIFDREADTATVMHEVSHFFLESLYRIDKHMQENNLNNAGLRAMLADFEAWAGIGPGQFLQLPIEQRAAIQERFATTFLAGMTREKFDKKLKPLMATLQAFTINALSKQRRQEFKAAVDAYKQQHPGVSTREARQEAAAQILEQEHATNYGANDLPPVSPEMKRFVSALYVAEQQAIDIDARYDLDTLAGILDQLSQAKDIDPATRLLYEEIRKDIDNLKIDIHLESAKQNAFASSLLLQSSKQLQQQIKQYRKNGTAGDLARADLIQKIVELRKSKAFRDLVKKKLDRVRQSRTNKAWYAIKGDNNRPFVGLDRAYAKAHLDAETVRKLEAKGLLTDKGGQEPIVDQIDMYWSGHDSKAARYENMCHALANRKSPRKQAYNEALKAFVNDMKDSALWRYIEDTKDIPLGAEARAKIIRKTIIALNKAIGGRKKIASHATLRTMAKNIMRRMAIKDMDVETVLNEAQKYNRRAIEALKQNDIEGAMHNLTMQEMLTLQAAEIAEAGAKIKRRAEKLADICNRSDQELSKNYNATLMMVPRAILARIGLGNMGRVRGSMERLREYAKGNPELQQAVDRIDDFLEPGRFDRDWRELSYEDLELALNIADMGRFDAKKNHRVSYGDGIYDGTKAQGELLTAIKDKPSSKISTVSKEGYGGQQVERNMAYRRWVGAEFIKSWIIRPLARFEAMGKPFVDHIYTPVRKAYDRYLEERSAYYRKVEAILNNLEFREGEIQVPELMIKDNHGNLVPLSFGATGTYKGCGQLELLGMLLHCGNQSNFSKLLRGYGWTPEQFDIAIQRLIADGWITKNMMDTVQAIWDANKATAAKAQRAYYSMHGYYFKEIEPRAIETPWGTYEGGYVPALTNRDLAEYNSNISSGFEGDLNLTRSNRIDTRGQEGNFQDRNEAYAQPLIFDPIRILNQNERIIRYANMMPLARAIERTWQSNNGELIEAMRRVDPNFWNGFMLPWLKDVAEGVNIDQVSGITKWYNNMIRRTGAAIMCFNLSNTLQQVTGYMVALTKIGPMALARGFAMTFSKQARENMLQKSQYMRNRLRDAPVGPRGALNNIILDPSKRHGAGQKTKAVYDRAQRFSAKNAYFFQKVFQNAIDTTVWLGSYEDGLRKGLSEADAVAKADRTIIETQGSYDTIDLTNIEKSGPLVRSLTMFGSYFYSIASLIYGEWMRAGNAANPAMLRRFYILSTAFFIPNIMATMIAKAMSRDSVFYSEDDKNEDPEDMLAFRHAAWFDTIFGSQITAAAGMIPIFGTFATAAFNQWKGNTYYTDTRFNSPVFTVGSALASSTKKGLSILAGDDDDEITYSDVRNFAQGFAVVTGLIPAAPIGRSLSYWYGVEQSNQINPTDMADYIFGLITGKVSPKSKE